MDLAVLTLTRVPRHARAPRRLTPLPLAADRVSVPPSAVRVRAPMAFTTLPQHCSAARAVLGAPARTRAAARPPPLAPSARQAGRNAAPRVRCSPPAAASATHAVAAAASAAALLHADAAAAACSSAGPADAGEACAQALFQLATLDAAGAASVAGALGPFLSVATLLFIIRRAPCCGAPGTRCRALLTRLLLARLFQDRDDVVPQHQRRRLPLAPRLRAHGAAAGAHAQAHHARGVRAAFALDGEGGTRMHEPRADARTLARAAAWTCRPLCGWRPSASPTRFCWASRACWCCSRRSCSKRKQAPGGTAASVVCAAHGLGTRRATQGRDQSRRRRRFGARVQIFVLREVPIS
jgi:hypothetical protein